MTIAGEQSDVIPIDAAQHAVTIELDFVAPLFTSRAGVDQGCWLRRAGSSAATAPSVLGAVTVVGWVGLEDVAFARPRSLGMMVRSLSTLLGSSTTTSKAVSGLAARPDA